MSFDYAKFSESWSALYKPMLHVPGPDSTNRRFYICDSFFTMSQFVEQGMDPDLSPCLIIESQQEGNIEDGWDYPRYTYYFMVRAEDMNDGYAAIAVKSEAKRHMMAFINFLRVFKEGNGADGGQMLRSLNLTTGSYLDQLRTAILEFGDRSMENIDIDDIAYDSINQMYNGWYAVTITLTDKQLFNKCIDQSLYL